MSFEVNVLMKTTLILVCVGLIAAVMRRSSASARYAVWAFGLLAVLAFPVVSGVLPSIDLPLLPPAETPPAFVEALAEPMFIVPISEPEEQAFTPPPRPAIRWTL